MKAHALELTDALRRSDQGAAENAYRAGLAKAPNAFVQLLRKEGTLRFSRYDFASDILIGLLRATSSESSTELSAESRRYLRSMEALGAIAPAVQKRFLRIRETINARSFKSYLVTVDCLFREKHEQIDPKVRESWQNFSKEELCDAFSYYCSLLGHNRLPDLADLNLLIESKVGGSYYRQQLAELARIIRFRDAELMVEALPYFAETRNNVTTVAAEAEDFERATRWGYLRYEQQREADQVQLQRENLPSIADLAKALAPDEQGRLFEVVQHPKSRIRLHLPRVAQFSRLFAGEESFREDYFFIRHVQKSLHLSLDQVYSTPIFKSITLHDLVRFQRLSLYLTIAMEEYCRSRKLTGTAMYYRSLVPVFSPEDAETVIREFCGIAKPEDLLELLSADPTGPRVMDLLHTPVLPMAGRYVVAVAVAAHSNVARNALQRSRFRFDADDGVDPVGTILMEAFAAVGVTAKQNVKYRHGSLEGEVDVLALVDGHLFAFECKNSLHPCNVHELRQSYGYLEKAFGQLSRFRDCMEHREFRAAFGRKCGFDLLANPPLATCVAMGNQMFLGLERDGHCVRPIYELQNMITGGAANFTFPKSFNDLHGPKSRLRLAYWTDPKFRASDLVDYLHGNSLHRLGTAAMDQYDEIVRFGASELRFSSFVLDMVTLSDRLRQHPRVSVLAEDETSDQGP